MIRLFTIASVICLVASACKIQHFVQKQMDIDRLPRFLPKDSIVFMPPAFSMHSLGDRFDVEYPIGSFGKKDTVSRILARFLARKGFQILSGVSTDCITNKMQSENWRDTVWYTIRPYTCLQLTEGKYNILLYNRMDIHNGVSYSLGPMNGSMIQTLVIVIKNGSLVYTKHFCSLEQIKEKLVEGWVEKSSPFPYFPNHQIELVIGKVTEDLFKRIKE